MQLKLEHMPALKTKLLRYESDSWKRSLGFMMEENIHLKNRLSEVLQNKIDKSLLEEIERFQSSFIKEDELVSLLRNDIAELDKLLMRERYEDGEIQKKLSRKVKTLRNNINIAEKQFLKLKSEFTSYLLENI